MSNDIKEKTIEHLSINYIEFLQQVTDNANRQISVICKEVSSADLRELSQVILIIESVGYNYIFA